MEIWKVNDLMLLFAYLWFNVTVQKLGVSNGKFETLWDPGSKIWDQDLVKNLRHRDAKSPQNKILTEIWRSGQNFLRPMCLKDYIISILYPYIWSKGNKLFIYKIIKPPGKEIFRPQIWPIVHVMHTILLNGCYCAVSWILRLWKNKIHEFTQKKIEEEYCVV